MQIAPTKQRCETRTWGLQVRQRNGDKLEDVHIPKNVKAIVVLNLQAGALSAADAAMHLGLSGYFLHPVVTVYGFHAHSYSNW